jgi:hypothetical protein
VVVVDPGVGTERRPIAARWRGQTLILPDNGLTTLLEDVEPLAEVRRIANPAFLREQISATFHGRDIFAPAAAALASGGRFEDMGEAVANWARLPIPQPETGADGVTLGEVIHIDRFGNCVTNIRAPGAEAGRLTVGEGPCAPLSATYGAVHPGETLALAGSTGLLELAVNQGNAAARHGVRRGMAARFVPGGSI